MAAADIGDGPAPRVTRLDAVYAPASVAAQQYAGQATHTATPNAAAHGRHSLRRVLQVYRGAATAGGATRRCETSFSAAMAGRPTSLRVRPAAST